MALVRPIINTIDAFDAHNDATISFVAYGGDQITGNEIKIVTNDENETLVYDDYTVTYDWSHTIPADTLTNGVYYKIAVRTYDVLENTSDWSIYQPFYCYTTPTVFFTTISTGQTVEQETFNVVLKYDQIEGEKVDHAIIQLYDGGNILCQTSGYIYDANIPPLLFSYELTGLVNHTKYTLQGIVVTKEGTVVKTDKVVFYVDNESGSGDSPLIVSMDSCNGYINLRSTKFVNFVATTNPTQPIYVENNTMIDLLCPPDISVTQYSSWVQWHNGLSVPSEFLLRLWFYPAKSPYKILTLTDDLGSYYFDIWLNRGSTQDYISIRTDNGTIIDKGLGIHCNGHTKVFLWISVKENDWNVQTEILDSENTIAEWNVENNTIQYNTDSDITWTGESFETFTPSDIHYELPTNNYNILRIGNGVYDHLNLSTDTTIPYTTVIPSYNFNTVLSVDFNGNVNNETTTVTKAILKRRDENMLNWINLSQIDIGSDDYSYIDFDDSYIPTGIEQNYALVTYLDNSPQATYTARVIPQWSKVFLSDKNNRFALNYAVIYSNNSQNVQNGVLMPIGAQYPIVIQNANGNYKSGSVQFKVLGYQFEVNKEINRPSIVKQLNDILLFLVNGKAKCLTDYNGNIIIFKVINSPQVSYDGNYGNGIATVSFDWVEQAKYYDYDSMLELGLFDYPTFEYTEEEEYTGEDDE